MVRTPGVAGVPAADDGLGADALLAVTPGIATELADRIRRAGSAQV